MDHRCAIDPYLYFAWESGEHFNRRLVYEEDQLIPLFLPGSLSRMRSAIVFHAPRLKVQAPRPTEYPYEELSIVSGGTLARAAALWSVNGRYA